MAVRMSVNLSNGVAQTIKELAQKKDITVTELVRRSVGTEMWRQDVESRGGRVLVEQASGRIRVIHFNVGRFWRVRRILGLKSAR